MIDVSNAWEQQIEDNLRSAGIGAKIRRLRQKRSMGLVQLGQLAGISASYLSQLETGRVVPTLRNLSHIAMVFGKDLGHFFEDTRQNSFRISHGNLRTRISLKQQTGSMISESLGVLIPDRSLVPCIAEFPICDSDVSFVPERFAGEEFAYVLTGSAAVVVAGQEQALHESDVMWIDGTSARTYRCKAGQTARLMIVTCPFADRGRPLQSTSSPHF